MEDNRFLLGIERRQSIPTKLEWYKTARSNGYFPLSFNFLYIRQDRYIQCSYCGKWVHEKKLTRDHVYPKSLGGQIKTPSCLQCNIDKDNMKPIEWAIHAHKNNLDFAEDIYAESGYFNNAEIDWKITKKSGNIVRAALV